MGAVPADARKSVGEKVNALKDEVEAAFEARLAAIARALRDAELRARPFDLTLPGPLRRSARARAPDHAGARRDRRSVPRPRLRGRDGPEVELEENNFTKLGFPPDHPATDMQDSFWIAPGSPPSHAHEQRPDPRDDREQAADGRASAPGAVYRRDDDATHSPMFHQIEGFLVDEQRDASPS